MEFIDAQTFGLDWKEKHIRLGVGTTGRNDNTGKRMSLPRGAIGYVISATPRTILVLFGKELLKPPPPTSNGSWAVGTSLGRLYSYVTTFDWNDWTNLDIRREK
ncbi:hypothetical protein [Pseudoduganella albidiflava]|uniref:Uncharacterized protein n=1 Tax=Pseudoduganella albidiflava TaxID=321983 RepID=A0A411WU00_9BURK|nr:hypothetical protein [Pseudoduganella albidiflava]QBI00261.1 hypothetical protein EYF70_04880 [Pseudoduganella albidiflava]GGY52508.1 hypothetical protein GCM10007387_38440 [Pseudoduganella albidiflava]